MEGGWCTEAWQTLTSARGCKHSLPEAGFSGGELSLSPAQPRLWAGQGVCARREATAHALVPGDSRSAHLHGLRGPHSALQGTEGQAGLDAITPRPAHMPSGCPLPLLYSQCHLSPDRRRGEGRFAKKASDVETQ